MPETTVACVGVDSTVRLALSVHDADSTVTKVALLAASTAGSTGTSDVALAVLARVAAERAIDAPDSAVIWIVEAGSVASDAAEGEASRLSCRLSESCDMEPNGLRQQLCGRRCG